MRLRLLRRRLTVSASRMDVRSATPWPVRLAFTAIAMCIGAAIAVWVFDYGQDNVGLGHDARQELRRMRAEVESLSGELGKLRDERDKVQSVVNTADTLVTAGKASQDKLLQQVKQLQAENQGLRNDLGVFEKLIPSSGVGGVSIRGLQADVQNGTDLRWQVLVIQTSKNAAEFSGRLELTFNGLLNGKPWTAALSGGPQAFSVKQYGRLEGVFEVPPQAVVKSVVARVLQGSTVRDTQFLKL